MKRVKIGLAVLLVFGLLGICMGAYTRDVSRDLDWGILYALEYIISDGIAVTTSGTVTEASAAAIAADLNELTAAPVAKAWVMGGAVVASGPLPAPLAASETFARKVVMTAVKADGTANTGIIYVGDANLVDTTAACIQLAPGDSLTLEGSPGTKFDLNLLELDGPNVADGVRYIYQPI